MKPDRARRMARVTALLHEGHEDGAPELSLLNLVDLMLVFAVGLMLAIFGYYGLQGHASNDVSVTAPGERQQQDTEVIEGKLQKVERMRVTQQSLRGEGVRIGVAYRLSSGEVVYVPEAGDSSDKDVPASDR